ncbi:MAG: hypothetical protein EPO22_07355 [Dehalococcoidia bacterium]|nr:MAG: hypothetical protein EPO22_07355 [Dehalococcoidia bacterium]
MALLGASCSSSGQPVPKSSQTPEMQAFVTAFNAIGSDIRQQTSRLQAANSTLLTPGQAAPQSYALAVSDLLKTAADRLGRLTSPPALRSYTQDLVDATRENAVVWQRYANQLSGSDSREALATTSAGMEVDSQNAAEHFTAACTALKREAGTAGLSLDMDC